MSFNDNYGKIYMSVLYGVLFLSKYEKWTDALSNYWEKPFYFHLENALAL